jgi:hypothetical protein
MFRPLTINLTFCIFAAPLCAGQTDLGFIGGFGVPAASATASLAGASATAGFQQGGGVGVLLGTNSSDIIGGDLRYLLLFNDLKLSQGGNNVTFGSRSHLIHYDLLIHARPRGYRVRPFVAVGGGIRYVEGTGAQQVYQPLSQYALLTQTRELLPLISAGGGIKFRMTRRFDFRMEVRDFMSPHPTKVIAAAPGASLHGWVHEITAMAELVMVFRSE